MNLTKRIKLSGELKLLMGATLFSLIPVGVKLGHEITIYSLLFGRLLIAVVLLFLFEKNKKALFHLNLKQFCLVLFWTMLMLGAMVCYFLAIRFSSMSVSSALLGIQPVIMVFMAAGMMREKISKRSLAAALIAFAGILCTIQISDAINKEYILGEILAIIAAFLLSLNYLVKKKYLGGFNSNRLTFYQCLFQLPILLPFLFWETGTYSLSVFAAMIFLGVFCTVLGYNLIFSGI